MNRWVRVTICAVLGAGLAAAGWLAPVHLRAVEAGLLQKAGRNTPSLPARGLELVREKQLGAAQMLLAAARQEALPGREQLDSAINTLAAQHPGWQSWGGGDSQILELLFGAEPQKPTAGAEPLTNWAVREANRSTVLELLRGSHHLAVQELLRCRALTNTVIFSPSASSSGQALDAALAECGLLLEEGRLAPNMSNALFALVAEANRGGNSQPLEQALLDLMTLGRRFNWNQLAVFVGHVEDTETLRLLANVTRQSDAQLPVLFSAVQLSGQPAGVAKYLMTFSRSGLQDLGASLRCGAGGVKELLRRNQRFYSSAFRERANAQAPFSVLAELAWRLPGLVLALKGLLLLGGGFLLALAMHFTWPAVSALERPLQVRGFHVVREILFALGFLLVVLLLSEPFLAQESQKVEFPFRLHLSMVGRLVPAGAANAHPSLMNQLSLLPLLLFFVLQGLIYSACLFKLAEIRRQRVTARIKLKLLENEDHMFDAGLYLGFVGTIISLILVSLGVVKFSLMAAYSSTSFGIIFVSVFKIFHLRPARRKLLLEAEGTLSQSPMPTATPRLATPS